MGCFSPLTAYRGPVNPDTGKNSIVFKFKDAVSIKSLQLPCGQCIGCRLEYSRQWAIRCVHESQLYENNCFITLTFNEEKLPSDGSLDVAYFQKFMKRLRKKYVPTNPYPRRSPEWFKFRQETGIRFFHCGEYGDHRRRPHYHACLFNFQFADRYLWQVRNGIPLYRSPSLEKLWTDPSDKKSYGYSSVGDVTFESAAYVARYILKKYTGKFSWYHYCDFDYETGEITNELQPEYTTQSRDPGLAKGWFDKYSDDVYPSDYVVLRGKKMRPPKFYDGLYEICDPEQYGLIKEDRILNAKKHAVNNTPDRLFVREKVQMSKVKQLPRNHDI